MVRKEYLTILNSLELPVFNADDDGCGVCILVTPILAICRVRETSASWRVVLRIDTVEASIHDAIFTSTQYCTNVVCVPDYALVLSPRLNRLSTRISLHSFISNSV